MSVPGEVAASPALAPTTVEVETMTDDTRDHAEVRSLIERHAKGYRSSSDEAWNRQPICVDCQHAWPCDTAVVGEVAGRWLADRSQRNGTDG